MSLARKANLVAGEEQTSLPLENVKSYLIKMLEKTHNQKQILDNECRKAQEILKIFCLRKKLFEINKNDTEEYDKCSLNHLNSAKSLQAEKEVVLEIDAAIESAKNVMKEIEQKIKVPKKLITVPKSDIQNIKRPSKEKKVSLQSSKDKNKSMRSLAANTNCSKTVKKILDINSTMNTMKGDLKKDFELNKKCVKTSTGGSQFVTTYRRDFVSLNNQIKTASQNHTPQTASSSCKYTNSEEFFNFKGIDDILKRVTPCPTTFSTISPSTKASELVENDVASQITGNGALSTAPYSVNNSSKELINVLNFLQKLILDKFRNKKNQRNHSASYLQKLSERGKSFTSSSIDSYENYKISMEMMSKCSAHKRKEYAACLNSDIKDILRVLLANEPASKELDLKVCALEAKYLQIKLLGILQEDVSSCHNHSSSTLFYKTCETLMNISPKFQDR